MGGAEGAYRRALTVRDDPDAHFLLAGVLLGQGKPAEALEHLEPARRALPDSPDLLLASARAQLAQGRPRRARAELTQLVGLAPRRNLWPKRREWATAELLLADLEPSAREDHLGRAWSIHPATAAELSFMRGTDLPRVRATFRQEAEDRPWDWYAQANYGMVLLATGQALEARDTLRGAIALAPQKEVLRFNLARAEAQIGRHEQALSILGELLQTLPESRLRRDVHALHEELTAGRSRSNRR
jgi:tetratricopeptide (TPR) repeat protein